MNDIDAEKHLSKLNSYADTLIRDATEIQALISGAKTRTKADFYGKKMKKIRNELQRVLATSELVKMAAKGQQSTDDTDISASPTA